LTAARRCERGVISMTKGLGHTCLTVMYHYVRDSSSTQFPDIKALSPFNFADQLDWLCERFKVLSFGSFWEALNGKGFARPSALLTFDDGFIDHYRQAWPLLRERGLKGIFFLCGATLGPAPRMLKVHQIHFLLARMGAEALRSAVLSHPRCRGCDSIREERPEGLYRYDRDAGGSVKQLLNYVMEDSRAEEILEDLFAQNVGPSDRFARDLYMGEEQIREMAEAGSVFGAHSHSHPVLSRLCPLEQRRELAEGARTIKGLTGQSLVPFSYPYGHPHTYTNETMALLKELGHCGAFNTARHFTVAGEHDIFQLPRMDTKDLPPFKDFAEVGG